MKNHITAPRPNLNPKALPMLALAGRAVLTFRNLETGTHFTAKIKQLRDKADRKIKLPIYYVNISLLNDGRFGYRFAGTYFSDTKNVKLSRESNADPRLARVFQWLISAILDPEAYLRNAQTGRLRVGLFHEGSCCCCGLPLTHPESVYTGIGPVCYEREQKRLESQNINIQELFEQVEQVTAA